MAPTDLHPVSPQIPLLVAAGLAAPATLCGVWLASAPATQPLPVRLMDGAFWRTLLIGSDLGRLLRVADAALVDAGDGPVLISAADLLRARRVRCEGRRTSIRYLG